MSYDPAPFSHRHHIRFVRGQGRCHGALHTDHIHFHVWRKLKATSLDAAYAILAPLYVAAKGRPAWDPVCMLRSCLAMMLRGITSFDIWVQTMRTDPFYAIISGFLPEKTPGVGTFYDFQDRLLGRKRQRRTTPTPSPTQARQGRPP